MPNLASREKVRCSLRALAAALVRNRIPAVPSAANEAGMNLKPKRNPGFLLLALLVLASAVAIIFFGDDLQRLTGQSDGALVFPRLRPDQIVRIEIDHRGARATLEHARRAGRPQPDGGAPSDTATDSVPRGDWHLIAPRQLPADEADVHALLQRLASLAPLRELPSAGPTAHGLSTPRFSVRLTEQSGAQRKLTLGDVLPEGGVAATAVRGRGSRGAFVIGPEVATSLMRPGLSYREGRLTSLPVKEATAVRIDRGRERLSLVLAAEGGWAVDGVSPADEGAVRELLARIGELRAERFIVEGEGPHDLAALGLDPPEVRARIDVGGAVLRVGVRRKGQRVIATNLAGGPVIEVPDTLMKSLGRPAAEWASSRALRFEPDRAAAIRWSRRGALVLLARARDGQWTMLAPAPAEARPEAVRKLLVALAELRMESPRSEPAALAKYGLAPASLEIAIDDETGRRVDSLHLGRVQGKKRWARNPQWSTLFYVDAAALAALPVDPSQLALPPRR